MPFFTVIIPTFNRLELLSRTLETVWNQQFGDFEVIVVDDGSTDGTLSYLKNQKNRLQFISQNNRGPGAARNAAARNASGEYLAFLDSDDLWFPWTLDVYQQVARGHSAPGFIAGKPYRFRNEHEAGTATQETVRVCRFADYLASSDEWRWWGVSSFVIRRDAFIRVGGFTDQWVNGEDADLALKLGIEPGFVQVMSPSTFAYREHDVSAIRNFERTVAGVWLKIETEKASKYPGGRHRAIERRRVLTRHIRPVSIDCLRHGRRREAWSLYRATFSWNLELIRAKYLAGFPLMALASKLRTAV